MNQILSGLAGAVALAAIYGIVVGWRKVSKAAADLTAAFRGIPQLVKSNQEVAQALHRFAGELEFLRTVVSGGTPPAEPGQEQTPGAQPKPRGGPATFPTWQPFVAVTEAPDATVEDTEVIEQNDAALAEQEAIEEIRGRGFAAGEEADPMSNPPGMTANV